jgi:hypothetical protein
MRNRPNLKVVSSNELASDKPPAPLSKAWEITKLTSLLIASLIIWGGVIWYCVIMWKAR